jgi:hypothetical protein
MRTILSKDRLVSSKLILYYKLSIQMLPFNVSKRLVHAYADGIVSIN